jgi:putative component of membrane protein insertase Oxa1/YidC/SpoIIIJ protein YidD
MKWLLLMAIRFYWQFSRTRETGRCIFKISCSHYVFGVTEERGLFKGLVALRYRFLSCREGYHILDHPITGSRTMVLCTGQEIPETEMAMRFLRPVMNRIINR